MSLQAREAVQANRQVTGIARYILQILADHNTSGRSPYKTYPGLDTVAYQANMSVRQVQRHIKLLCERGYLLRKRRQDGMTYYILLDESGGKLPIPDTTHDDVSDTTLSSNHATPDTTHDDVSDTTLSFSDTTFSISDTTFSSRIKGTKDTEKDTEKERGVFTFPQPPDRGDRASADTWRRLLGRIENREALAPNMAGALRKGRLELYAESGDALVIVPSNPDWYAAQFLPLILRHLPDAAGRGGWRVDVFSHGEIAAAEKERVES